MAKPNKAKSWKEWIVKHKKLAISILVVLFLVIIAQILHPSDRTLPFARIDSQNIGYHQRDELAADFQKSFETADVTLRAGDKTETISLSELGASLNADTMALKLVDYPLWLRLVPFSILFLSPNLEGPDVTFTGSVVKDKIGQLSDKLASSPVDASLSIQDGKLAVVNAKSGHRVDPAKLLDAIITTNYQNKHTTIEVETELTAPATSDNDIAEVTAAATNFIKKPLKISVNGAGDFTPDENTKAGWLKVISEGKTIKIEPNTAKIDEYVKNIAAKVNVAAGTVQVRLLDGVEVGRSDANSGLAIDEGDLIKRISETINNDETQISVDRYTVQPSINYVRNYSSSEKGLRAYVDYITTTQNIRISLVQLNGAGWTASGRAYESIPSASTYKLFVMLRVFDDINNGSLSWDTPMLDTNTGVCFERTIVPSTNPCAEEWIRRYGRENLTNYVHAKGFSSGTGFTFSDANHTTAADLTRYMIGLNNGTLVTGSNRDMLLEKMGRQLYPYGIPAGSKGKVYDKVGFLWSYIHDTGIVYHPKGTYVLTVMTSGYSYAKIAEITRQVEAIMYP